MPEFARALLTRYVRVGLGLAAILATVGVLVMSYAGGLTGLFSGSKQEVVAEFAASGTLRRGDPVRVQGVTVGAVTRVVSIDRGRGSRVTMELDRSAGSMHADARAKVTWKTLLGGAFAVEIDPGSNGELVGAISRSRTAGQVELDEVASVVSGSARRGLRTIPPELTDALRDPQALRRVAKSVDGASPSLRRGLSALRGVDEDEDLAQLVRGAAATVKALDAPDDGLRELVSAAGGTLQVTARREAELRRTLALAPGVLTNASTTLTRLQRTLKVAKPVVEDLEDPAGDVAPALRRLRPVLSSADRLVARATPLLRDLRPSVAALASAVTDGTPLLDDLEPSLRRLDDKILPYLNEKDPETERSAAEMVGPALGGLGNVGAQVDPNGHVIRFPITVGSSSAYLPCQVYLGNPDQSRVLACRALDEILKDYLSWNPLAPAEGTLKTKGKQR